MIKNLILGAAIALSLTGCYVAPDGTMYPVPVSVAPVVDYGYGYNNSVVICCGGGYYNRGYGGYYGRGYGGGSRGGFTYYHHR